MAAMVETALLEDITYTNVFGHLILEKNWLYIVLAFLLLRHRVYTNVKTCG